MSEIPVIHSAYDTKEDLSILTKEVVYGEHRVPEGFPTDFTSTRWYIRWLVPRFGKGNMAALIHDYYYMSRAVSRKEADKIYRQVLIECGVNKVNAYLRYYGVRMLGGSHYKEIGEG